MKINRDEYIYRELKKDLGMNKRDIFSFIIMGFKNGQRKASYDVFLELSYIVRDEFVQELEDISIMRYILHRQLDLQKDLTLTMEVN